MPPKGSKLGPPPVPIGPPSAAEEQQQANSGGIADFELPKTTLAKLAKGSVGTQWNIFG
jgi:DNA polymerase epsilon subunit 3